MTAREAVAAVQQQEGILAKLSQRFNCKPEEVPARVEALQEEIKKLQQQLKKGAATDLNSAGDKLLAAAVEVNGTKLIVGEVPTAPAEQLQAQADRLRQKAGRSVIVFGWTDEGKGSLLAAVTDDLTSKIKAGDLVKKAAAAGGGKGGGKPTMAQAGGVDPAKLPDTLKTALDLARQQLQ